MGKARVIAAGEGALGRLKDAVAEIFAEQAIRDAKDVDAMSRYADLPHDPEEVKRLLDLPDAELKKKGWSRRQLKIAIGAASPRANAPFGAISAHERTLARIRRTEDAPAAMKIGIAIGVLPPRAERKFDADVVVVEDPNK